jgi:hypothetical protein
MLETRRASVKEHRHHDQRELAEIAAGTGENDSTGSQAPQPP